jgi:mono/diheme cytochrome c family protein
VELQRVLSEGSEYPAHKGQQIPNWKQTLSTDESNALLNFLAAPDGQRLFALNCSGCHGLGVSFVGTESQLRDIIAKGGQHLSMPAWRVTLSSTDLNTLAAYVVDPSGNPTGKKLFDQHCSTCHGEKVPQAPDLATAIKVISNGGPHVSMPVWGNILTPEMLDALVKYALASSQGLGGAEGAKLFADNCSACHGQYGQGGPNPGVAGDIIVSISSSDFLKTRDDATIRSIIEQGQADSGMPPFGSTYGGSLDDTQLDALVAFIRNWETNPPPKLPTSTPVVTPTKIAVGTATPETVVRSFSGQILPIFSLKCFACHNQQIKLGGWDSSSYSSVMTTGDEGPVIIPGDASNSLLAKKLLGTQGGVMPPSGPLSNDIIHQILDWINAGALNN